MGDGSGESARGEPARQRGRFHGFVGLPAERELRAFMDNDFPSPDWSTRTTGGAWNVHSPP